MESRLLPTEFKRAPRHWIQLAYKKQDLGSQFTELTSLMGFEQRQLGTLFGTSKADISAGFDFSGKKLNVTNMGADSATGSAKRTSVAFKDKNIDFQGNQRSVATGFTGSGQLADSESALLASMVGYRERDAKLKWQIAPSLKVESLLQESETVQGTSPSKFHQFEIQWDPNRSTSFDYYHVDQSNHTQLATLFAAAIERMSLTKDLGKYGRITLRHESDSFDKSVTQLTDFKREYIAYETRLDKRTSFKTEETRTEFGNGGKEDVNANTISTTLTKRLGVSVTEMQVGRSGNDQTTETNVAHRNYGFWYDFGNGLTLSYGYARQLADADQGTQTSTVTLGTTKDPTTPDKIGGVGTGGAGDVNVTAGYGANEWDSNHRTQSFSNIALSSKKAIRVGPFSDVQFNVALDSAADYAQWLKEDRTFAISGKFASNLIGYDYRSQLDASGYRAIDRTYKVETDPSEKKPFKASVFYKVRTLPWDQQVMIRNYSFTARPMRNLSVTNQLSTNPEVAQPNTLLGSVAQATRSNKWMVDYKENPNLTFGGSCEELINDQAKTTTRTGGLTATLFERTGSPFKLFYGLEQSDQVALHRTTQRYSVQYDQKAGPNQNWSFFLGNVNYAGSVASGFNKDNWSIRLNYQIRF
jgi:hypothetical protein